MKEQKNINFNYISAFAGVMSALIQYNQLGQTTKLKVPAKIGVSVATFGLCFYFTRLVLRNINEM